MNLSWTWGVPGRAGDSGGRAVCRVADRREPTAGLSGVQAGDQ